MAKEDPGYSMRNFLKSVQQRVIIMKDKVSVLMQGKELLMQERF